MTGTARLRSSMGRYLLRRTVGMMLMLILISVVSYSMIRLLPGDPVVAMFGERGDPVQMARVRADLGLDQPPALYYFVWVGRVLTGDFGRSLQSNKPVLETLREKLVPTVQLTVTAVLVTALIALPLGVGAAIQRGTVFDMGAG